MDSSPARLVKFNYDAGFKQGVAALGVTGRISSGQIVDGKGCRVKATYPLQSEFFAIRQACAIINFCRIACPSLNLIVKSIFSSYQRIYLLFGIAWFLFKI